MDHMSGQRAVVMGGSSGIGLATAKLLSSLGAGSLHHRTERQQARRRR